MPNGIFDIFPDISELLYTGFATGKINAQQAKYIHRRLEKTPLVSDSGHTEEFKKYRNRSMAEWMEKNQPPKWITSFSELLLEQLFFSVEALWEGEGRGIRDQYCIQHFVGHQGYHMDWHEDLSQRSIFILMIYFSGMSNNMISGGDLEISRVKRDVHNMKIADRELMTSVRPENGNLVIFDGARPDLQHRVTELKSRGDRHILAISLGTDRF